jgi:hypothetical protein
MDAVGFGLERFDAVGAYRTEDVGEVIEPAGLLMGETEFADAIGLARAVRSHPNLGPCMLNKVLIYALGRGFDDREQCMLDDLDTQAAAGNYQPNAIVDAIVTSPLFLIRGSHPNEQVDEGSQP